MTLLPAALSLALFLFTLRLVKGFIGRWRLIGVLVITINPLLQFFGAPFQLGNGAGQLKDAFFKHLDVAAHSLRALKPFGCGKWPLNFHGRVFSIAKIKKLGFYAIISISCIIFKFNVISIGYIGFIVSLGE